MATEVSWQRDMVLTELRRSYPNGLEKEVLQERTGIGTGDLRETIADLTEEGLLEETEDGWAITDPDDGAVAEADGRAAEALVDGAGGQPVEWEPIAPGDATEEEPLVPREELERATGGPYRARIVLDVTFLPEPEGETTADAQAVVDADAMREAAAKGILGVWSDVSVGGTVAEVVVYDSPRRVWPRA